MALTLEQFAENLARSGLMSAAELSAFREGLAPDKRPKDPQGLARELIQAGKLTRYQAAAVYQGKTKGLVLGNYTVLDQIGAGGMGQVLKAKHRTMDRIVALKVLPAKAVKSPEAVKRFRREVRAAAKLLHPNIVTAFDADQHEGIHYLVMELVDGKDLAAIVDERGPLPVEHAVECIIQAARGLEYAHGKGVVHRDIKPANLLLARDGTVKILDMGLARLGEPGESEESESLTSAGQMMGTFDYMAPEQAEDSHSINHRADIYSLGCTLYHLLTGERPYKGDHAIQILYAHREHPIPSLCEARPDVPAQLDAVFQKMVAKRREDRYDSMTEVIAALEGCVAAKERQPVPPPPPSGHALTSFLQHLTEQEAGTPRPPGAEETLRSRVERGIVGGVTAAVKRRWRMYVAVGGLAMLGIVAAAVLLLKGGSNDGAHQTTDHSMVPAEVLETPAAPTQEVSNDGAHQTTDHSMVPAEVPENPAAPARRMRPSEPQPEKRASAQPHNDYDRFATGTWIPVLNSREELAEALLRWPRSPDDAPGFPAATWQDGEVHVRKDVFLLDTPVRDCIIRAKIRKVRGHSLGFQVTYGHPGHVNGWFESGKNWCGVGRAAIGQPYEFLWEYSGPVPNRQGDFFDVAFAAVGDLLAVYVNGKELGRATDEERKAGVPRIYVFNWRRPGLGVFKDIEIQVLDADWSIEHKGSLTVGDESLLSGWNDLSNLGSPVNSVGNDCTPRVSADGLTLLLASDRRGGFGLTDLWISTRPSLEMPFGSPANLGSQVNSTAADSGAVLSADGLKLVFASDRPEGQGMSDLWMSTRTSLSSSFGAPVNLGPVVNSSADDDGPILSYDGLELLFSSDRPGGTGGKDLWKCSRASEKAAFGSPTNLGPVVNSVDDEGAPSLSNDGLVLLFTSDRVGGEGALDIWACARPTTKSWFGRPVNLRSPINSSANDAAAALSADGSVLLLLQSDRPGGEGEYDIWLGSRRHSPQATTEPK